MTERLLADVPPRLQPEVRSVSGPETGQTEGEPEPERLPEPEERTLQPVSPRQVPEVPEVPEVLPEEQRTLQPERT